MVASPLFPQDHPHLCEAGSACAQAVVVIDGRFFITFGHAGFNSPANNRSGYATEAAARAAIARYERRGRLVRR